MFIHNNKVILMGWIFNDNYKTDKVYNGVLSMPRIIEYIDGKIVTKPYIKSIGSKIIYNDDKVSENNERKPPC